MRSDILLYKKSGNKNGEMEMGSNDGKMPDLSLGPINSVLIFGVLT